jgi:hypothetical protein
MFAYHETKGDGIMSENEMKLIGMIRESDDPEKAIVVAVEVITDFLKQFQSSEEPAAACPPGLF